MTLTERWDRYQELMENDVTSDSYNGQDYACRGDGAIMLKDDDGWFLMVTDEDGHIWACPDIDDPLTQKESVYCEPIWLSWFADHFIGMWAR